MRIIPRSSSCRIKSPEPAVAHHISAGGERAPRVGEGAFELRTCWGARRDRTNGSCQRPRREERPAGPNARHRAVAQKWREPGAGPADHHPREGRGEEWRSRDSLAWRDIARADGCARARDRGAAGWGRTSRSGRAWRGGRGLGAAARRTAGRAGAHVQLAAAPGVVLAARPGVVVGLMLGLIAPPQ